MCDWKLTPHGDRIAVRATADNANLIFTYDPVVDGLFGYDEFQAADVFLKKAPWQKDSRVGEEWTDRDDAHLRRYIREVYTEFANDKLVADTVTCFSDSRAFHVVKDFFANLPEWDGIKRAETLFIKFLRADDTTFVRECTMNWLTAAVARIYHPGCDYQTTLVLHGAQGIGKTFSLHSLGGKWYGTLIDAVDDPHAVDAIQKLWLVEIKEGAAWSKADVAAQKRFLDAAEDTRRAAYEKRAKTVKRHCVFAITLNNDEFLSDATGNRRYLVIHCNAKPGEHVEGLTDDFIKQIWAEVKAHYDELFKDGFDEKKLALSRDAQKERDRINEDYLRDDLGGEIRAFLDKPIPPPIIWNLLSKEERRKFFKDGGRIFIVGGEEELTMRIKANGGRDVDRKRQDLNSSLAELAADRKSQSAQGGIIIYGSCRREYIFAVAVFNECFDNSDRRKTTRTIADALSRLDGWEKGKRIDRDPVYGCQKLVYYRDTDNFPEDEPPPENETAASSTMLDELPSEPIDPDDVPF